MDVIKPQQAIAKDCTASQKLLHLCHKAAEVQPARRASPVPLQLPGAAL
jgi:hypothetical protein